MDEMTYQMRENMLRDLFEDKSYRPMKLKELCVFLNVPKSEREDLKLMLDQMISNGQIAMTSDGRYAQPEADVYTGTFMGSTRGFGFVRVEGMSDDIFISERDTLGALHGDTVTVRITRRARGTRRCEGQILRIVSRANDRIVGTYDQSKKFGFVIPDNSKISKDIFVRSENSMGAVT